jgi:predicted nucleic acid-binding protein
MSISRKAPQGSAPKPGSWLPDAIQLASAVAINAFALVTHDRDFSAGRWFRIIR